MTTAWDQNQTSVRKIITNHITMVMGEIRLRNSLKIKAMEKAIENTESPDKGALGSSSSKKIIFKLF